MSSRSPLPVVTASPSVTWVARLFLLGVLLQRFSVPGVNSVPLLLPVVLLWIALALRRRIVEFDPTRVVLWGVAAVATGLTLVLQAAFSFSAVISASSWALVFTVSLPLVFRLNDRGAMSYREVLRRISTYGAVLAVGAILMPVLQLLGVAYRDYVAAVVPSSLLLDGYVISYPYTYGSPIFRSNAFIGLEPSFVSFQLGVALLAGVLVGRRTWVFLLTLGGLVSTAAGSGMLVVVVGLVVLLLWPRRRVLLRYLVPVSAGVLLLLSTPFGQSLFGRAAEGEDPQSSTYLRMIAPYQTLYGQWATDPIAGLLGRGAGASQRIVTQTGVVGLLVPTPAKIFFDYGLLAGGALAAFAVFCYLGGPSQSIATGLFVSLWSLQPGLTTILLTMNVVVLVSLWAPRDGPRLESTSDDLDDRAETERPPPAGEASARAPSRVAASSGAVS